MLDLIRSIFGSANERYLKSIQPDVDKINALESKYTEMSDADLRQMTDTFKGQLAEGATLDDILHDAFAVCREASRRVLKMRHYDVQLIGGISIHKGRVAEMRTGEGKTLVATLPVYLNALEGKGVHVITVNDYLATRDAEWMGRLYKWLGLSVGIIVADMDTDDRRAAYQADITYGTNNEFGFDYLRDNMKYSLEDYVQRDLHYAIIDEIDSILIDEARTPLIISGAAGLSTELPKKVNAFVPSLKKDEHYVVDEENRSVSLTDHGIETIEEKLGIDNLYEPGNIEVVHAVIKALQAHTLYKQGDRYMVKDGEIIIIDEFTGRPMEGRRWSDGLHQAIEAKENVEIQDENQTLATVTFQNFFRMYKKLSGMTGTAETESEEFHSIYNLDTVVIPTNKPIARIDQDDLVYRSFADKFKAVLEEITAAHAMKQPVLVGTTSVEKSEAISHVLKRKGIPHEVLNAKQHEREAMIVAQAGRLGAVTIATNMAGRGTDILLGGNPEAMAEAEAGEQDVPDSAVGEERFQYYTQEYKDALAKYEVLCAAEKKEVLKAGGLLIIGTERHESRRIDNQLRGRAGRQGDPGRSRFFLSLEDDLLRLFGGDRVAAIMDLLKMEPGTPIEDKMVTSSLEKAQRKVEGRNFDIRKNVLEYDDVMDQQRKTIYGLRRAVLAGKTEDGRSLQEMTLDLFEEVALATLDTYANPKMKLENWDIRAAEEAFKEIYGIDIKLSDSAGRSGLEETAWKRIEDLFRNQYQMTARIANELNQLRQNEAAASEFNEVFNEESDDWVTTQEVFEGEIRTAFLESLDKNWRRHLMGMEQLRDGIGMRGYAQKDPKKEYKKEGYNLFLELLMNIKTEVVHFVSTFKLQSPMQLHARRLQELERQLANQSVLLNHSDTGEAKISHADGSGVHAEPEPVVAIDDLPVVGRNDLCPCGSGKKFKQCHLREGGVEAALAEKERREAEVNAVMT